MKPAEIKPGQIWRSNDAGEEWLVTRTYEEFLDVYAVLRRTDGPSNDSRRVKVRADAEGAELPGLTWVEG